MKGKGADAVGDAFKLCSAMFYSKTREDYEAKLSALQDWLGDHAFVNYWLTTWDTVADSACDYGAAGVLNLAIRSTSAMERAQLTVKTKLGIAGKGPSI